MSDAGTNVFTYGTLTIVRVMEAVTGHAFVAEPALLPEYARYALRGETYPGLVCEATAACDGVLWRQVDDDSLRRLDAFEGDWYRRQTVTVLADGVSVAAETYVLVEAQHHRVSHRRWLRDRFERRFLQDFLAKYASEP